MLVVSQSALSSIHHHAESITKCTCAGLWHLEACSRFSHPYFSLILTPLAKKNPDLRDNFLVLSASAMEEN
jgi:hypothetical protein